MILLVCGNAVRVYLPILCMKECMQAILNRCLEVQYSIEYTQSKIRLLEAVSFGFFPTYDICIGGGTEEVSHSRSLAFKCRDKSISIKSKYKYSLIPICEIGICEIGICESFCITVFQLIHIL